MAIHQTLQLLTTMYRNEPTHIFIVCFNVLYLLNTQISHPTMHNNHLDKHILESKTRMLKSRAQLNVVAHLSMRSARNTMGPRGTAM